MIFCTFTFRLSPSMLSWYQSMKATMHLDMSIYRSIIHYPLTPRTHEGPHLTSEVDRLPGILRLIQHRVLDLRRPARLDCNHELYDTNEKAFTIF